MRTCGNCHYWFRFSDAQEEIEYGECRRYPPNPVKSKDFEVRHIDPDNSKTICETSEWSVRTNLFDWCGEFKTQAQALSEKWG